MAQPNPVSRIHAKAGRVVSACGKQVSVWSPSGALEWQAEADQYSVDHVLAHSSGRVVTTGAFGTVTVFDAAGNVSSSSTDEITLPGALFELADGRVAVGYEEYEDVRLLDLETGAFEMLEAQGEQGPSIDVRVADGKLSSLGVTQGIVRWDLATKKFIERVYGAEGEPVGFVGETLAASISSRGVAIWRAGDGSTVHEIGFEGARSGTGTVGADGKRIAIGIKGGVVMIDVASGTIERTIEIGPSPRLTTFSPDGSRVATIVNRDRGSSLKVFESASGKELGGREGPVKVSSMYFLEGVLLLGKDDGNVERVEM